LRASKDCESYDARITVTPAEGGGHLSLDRRPSSAPVRGWQAICDGTRAVFEAGRRLCRVPWAVPLRHRRRCLPQPTPPSLIFDDLPRLALTVTPHLGDGRLCLFLHGIGGGR
jgi:hypothetical protein